uniref:Tenascin XB n=1 Tax=Rousettus aegyptiacus TaxID=9407 RepID=A0A7J8KIZ1_ROUAE|nr:tenascin XB [Rousettus aegyptiacus]
MMPAQCFLTSNLALLVLLGTVRGGPFSSRSNMTLPAPRPPPQPGGRTAEPRGGNPSSQLYEHTVEGGEKQVVFTHRINLPPSAGCGCPPGTEPPVPASEVQALRVRLEILEELVKGLKEQCTGGCCPAAAEAGTGQTDVRSLCSLHGVFDLSRCACSCEPGWGGPTCSDSTDSGVHPSHPPSASETCPDDCNDQGRCVRGRCVCFPGYTGPSCGWPSCPGDCHGRGRCVQGVCVCRAGFSGNDCSLRSCPRGCSKRGRCENGRCVCNPGYTGEDCGVRSCPRGCSQKGRCEDGRCVCDPGYTGEDCGSRSCRWDCGEGGRCVDGHCVCWPGYAGEDCSTRTCPRDCQGRGRCEDGECICDTGYSGDDCGVRSCPGDCNQRGRCEDGSCVCWPGYTGPDCGARACPRNCRGRGRCENGVCVCNAGYSGEDCGVRSCPGDCRGRGRCESGRCVCWPGYTGRDCGTRACPGDCRGRGRCVDGLCVCNPGFTGEDCGSRRCPGDCRGRGRCEDGVCACDSGYEGEDCSARSCPGGCRGRGQCLDGRCVCDDEYSGDDCSVRRCPHDCNQRGVCQDGVCTCWEGYAGEDCGLRTCPSNCHRRGRCEDGRCVCDSGYTGPSCATRTCPADCRGRGRCVQGVCVCHAGYSGEDCGQEEPPASACPGGCGPRALCRSGQCVCVEGFRGPDCAIRTCPGDCRGRGECREGSCVCQDGFAGEDCGEEVPAIEGMRMHLLEETTVRTEWTRAPGPVDAYEIQFIPTTEGESTPFTARVPSSASAYDQRGLAPGQEYQVTVRALRGTAWGPPASKTITTMIDGPQDLRVVAVTPTTLELSWLRPQAEVDRFVVSYVSAGNQRVRLEVPAEADGTLLTDLMPGVEYVVTVTAEQGRAVSYPASVRANTGSSPLGLLEATDEPPPSGPSTTQGAQAPGLQQRPQELGELRVLGRDKTGHLHVAWMAQPDTFAHFQLRLRVPDGPGVHEELLPGNVRQALVPSPPPGTPYELSLRGVTPEGEPSAPLIYQGIMDRDSEKPGKPLAPPRLGELTVTDVTSNSLLLHWTVPEGEFDSFMIQYKDRNGSQMVPVEGPQRSALITNLDMGRKYKFVLYGLVGKKRHGPLVTEAKILPQSDPGPATTPRLGMLWVTDPSPDSLLLSWTVPEGHFDSFMVQYRDRDGRPQVIPVEGPERSVIVSPLDPDHKYRFTLFGIANKKRHGPLTADGTTAPKTREEPHHPEPPEQPLLGELTVTDVTPDSLHLSWTVAQGNFDSFMVQYKDAQGQPQAVPVSGDKNEVTVRSLESDRKYKMNLYGLHGKQRVGPVSVVATTAPQEAVEETSSPTEPSTEAPEPPEEAVLGELTVTGSSSDSLSLSWTVPQGHFDSFTIQYKDRDGRPQVVRVGGEEREVTVRGLEPGRKYKMHLYGLHEGWRVGPVSTVGVTEETLEATEHPLKPRLGDMTVTDVTPNSMGLTWTVPEGKFDSFVVQYKNKDGQLQVVPVTADQLEATIPGLEPAHKYKMNLYGLHGGQRVGPLSVVAMTAPLLPAPVTESPEKPHLGELTVTDVTPDSVSLSWTVPEGEFDSFIIKYKDRDGQPQVVSVAADQLEVTVPGLEPSRKYKFMLFGIQDGRRHGPVSVEAKTETQSAVGNTGTKRPPKPRLGEELQVTSVTPDSVGLSWTVPEGQFDSFVVQYKDRNGKPQVVPVDGSFKEVSVSGLDPARRYKLLLYGLHEGKRVGPVSTIAVTAPREEIEAETMAPSPPESKPHLGELMVDEATPYTLHLSWTVAEGEFDSFEIEYTDQDGQLQVVSIGGDQNDITLSGLDSNHRYQVNLYGFHGWERMGPTQVEAMTAPKKEEDKPSEATTTTPEHLIKPHLGELAVKDATPDSLRLSWTVSEGHFDHFLLQYKNGDGQPKEVWVPGHEDGVTISGLEPDHKYKMNLYGFHDGQRQGPVSAIGVTATDEETPAPTEVEETPSPKEPSTEAPEPPEEPLLGDLEVTGSSPDSLSLSWTVPQGHFDSFTVQYKDRDGRPQVVRVGGEESEVTVRGLEPGRKYKMHLYGLHGGRRVGPVSTVGVTAPPEKEWQPPSRLGELTVTDETPDSLHLSWTVAQGPIDSFVIQYRDTNGQPQAMSVAADQREVTVEGLEPGRKYKFLLYGLIGRKRLGPVSALGVTVPEEDTPAPWHPATEAPEASEGPRLGVLAVTDRTPDSLHLAWTVAQGPFDSFVVQYWDTNGQPQALLVGGDQNKVIVSGLEPSTLYKFFLYGLHEGKRLGPVSAKGTTGSAPAGQTPGEPGPRLSQLSVTDVTTSSLRLNWEAPPGAFDSFLLRYGVPSSTLEPHPRPLLQRELTVPGTRHSAALRDLRPGTLYSFTLYGLRGPHKADSIQGTARTLSPVLESPRDLQFSEIGETSAKVSWMPPPSRVDSFKVSYQLADGGEPQSVRVDGRARTQKLKGLIPGAHYEVTVVSVRGFEESEPLTGFLTTVPDGPTQLRALNLTEGTALLHWKPPQAPVDTYDVRVTAPGAPLLQASAPGSAVDYPLHDLMLHTNYTATVHGLRGPNVTSPASITFITGLEGPQDLEAKEVTPRTARLTWTEPQVPPTGYLLTYDTPGGQTQEVMLPGGVTSYQLLGLFPSTTYRAWLRAMWGESFTPPMSTFFTTGGLRIPFPRDCGEEMQNGAGHSRTTTIFLNGNRERPLNVFCDMETDGGGWLVFQRRMDGHTDFWRDWEDYAHGFGNISGEFWLGNEALHSLTKTGDYSMRVDLRAGDEAVFAQYDSFRVDSAADYYRLHLEGYHGTAGDSMSYHSGSVFSARDRDPNNLLISCAVSYRGAWWYRNCHYANLNGLYGSTVDHQGVSWYHWKGFEFSVPFTEMKLRPRSYWAPTWGH